MVIWVVFRNQQAVALPVLRRLGGDDIVFVGQRPPHVAERAVSGDHVFQVGVAGRCIHLVHAPAVIGVHEDDVRLDAQLHQLLYAQVEALEVFHIGPGVVKAIVHLRHRLQRPVGAIGLNLHKGRVQALAVAALEGVGDGLLPVEFVELGEHAEADLVEGRLRQRVQRLLLQFHALVYPGVAGRAHRVMGRSVGVGQQGFIHHPHRAMVVAHSGYCLKFPHHRRVDGAALDGIGIPALIRRHEAHAVHALAVVEAVDLYGLVFAGKCARDLMIQKRIALRFPIDGGFKHAPLFNLTHLS